MDWLSSFIFETANVSVNLFLMIAIMIDNSRRPLYQRRLKHKDIFETANVSVTVRCALHGKWSKEAFACLHKSLSNPKKKNNAEVALILRSLSLSLLLLLLLLLFKFNYPFLSAGHHFSFILISWAGSFGEWLDYLYDLGHFRPQRNSWASFTSSSISNVNSAFF